MKKKFRLKKPSDFKKAFRRGKRFLSPHFALYICKNVLQEARFGVSISKRHFKLATRRNRLRRVAKETFRQKINPSLKGCDLVVASRRTAPASDINAAIEELKDLMLRVKS